MGQFSTAALLHTDEVEVNEELISSEILPHFPLLLPGFIPVKFNVCLSLVRFADWETGLGGIKRNPFMIANAASHLLSNFLFVFMQLAKLYQDSNLKESTSKL